MTLTISTKENKRKLPRSCQRHPTFNAPTYQEYDNVQLVSTHVNLTIIDTPQISGDYWLSNAITIDYFRTKDSFISKVVSPDELMVMYWNNLASEAIIGGHLDLAFSYALQANTIVPLYPETLNLLAILYNRKGHSEYAYDVYVYDFMDKNNLVSFSAIDNFAAMLVNAGDTKRAALLRSKIQHIIDDNPYTWLSRGIAQFEKGEYKLAESYLLKSRSYGPYLHEPLYNLAKLYVKQNRFKAARNALEKAKELAYVGDDERRYQAKIYSLNE
ncbi:MAG: tetratricopeptide (TPR) repeat protein [Oceanospirillaceae bacterium]|jgi:tetratricopeptide (TPR) repeat protein